MFQIIHKRSSNTAFLLSLHVPYISLVCADTKLSVKKKQHSSFRIQMPVMTSIVTMLIQNQDQPGMMKTGWWHNMFLLMRSYLSSPFKCCFSSVPHSSWLLIWLYLSGMALGVQEKLQQFPITVCVEWVLPLVQEWEVMQTDNYITFSYFLLLLLLTVCMWLK